MGGILETVEREHPAWQDHNFPGWREHPELKLMGVVEELGELHHAILKQKQGIRGTFDKHEVDAKDAVGDLLIYLNAYCMARGWSISEILRETWEQVSQRDWIDNPEGEGV